MLVLHFFKALIYTNFADAVASTVADPLVKMPMRAGDSLFYQQMDSSEGM